MKVGIDAGASDHVLNGENIARVVTLLAEKLSGKADAAHDVDGSVFCSGAFAVVFLLQIPGVMEKDGKQGQFEHVRRQLRRGFGPSAALQQMRQAKCALQGVLEIM